MFPRAPPAQEYTIQQFAEKIRDLVRPGAEIKHLPATKDDPRKRRPDIALAKRVLNWEPRVSVVRCAGTRARW
jgi:nucleoside-diphosphate-sugar epimerase